MKACRNCKYRWWNSWSGIDCCIDYEMAESIEDEIAAAKNCRRYELGDPEGNDNYTPSATNRDYGPSNPWDAPGMSIRDFI